MLHCLSLYLKSLNTLEPDTTYNEDVDNELDIQIKRPEEEGNDEVEDSNSKIREKNLLHI